EPGWGADKGARSVGRPASQRPMVQVVPPLRGRRKRRIVAAPLYAHAYVRAGVHETRVRRALPMTDRSTAGRAPKVRSVPGRDRAGADPAGGDARIAAGYADRGPECVFANVRLLGRVVTSYYDEALKPVDLRASKLRLMWAVLASEPVEMGRLGNVTQTDQTTLSRTVDKLRQAGLVGIETGDDRRVRLLRLTAKGRRQFARA